MGIRREEEMEMSDDDMEDASESKDSDDSGTHNPLAGLGHGGLLDATVLLTLILSVLAA